MNTDDAYQEVIEKKFNIELEYHLKEIAIHLSNIKILLLSSGVDTSLRKVITTKNKDTFMKCKQDIDRIMCNFLYRIFNIE